MTDILDEPSDVDEEDDGSPPAHLSRVGYAVSRRAYRLQRAYMRDDAKAVASLARLRQGLGRSPGDDPDAWAETIGVVGDFSAQGDDPTPIESAVHVSLCLFGLHQQSHRDKKMHRARRSLGRAARQLADARGGDDEAKAVLRRFQALATAVTLEEAAHHARGLISQFRAEAIPLDYGLLADHLVKLQDSAQAPSVRLAWGRDYYRTQPRPDVPPIDPPGESA